MVFEPMTEPRQRVSVRLTKNRYQLKSLSERQENTPLVTVLMPVYNGERYLSAAIESILTQTFTNLEIMIINDGSTDHSRDMLIKYAAKDSRIILVHHETNLGLIQTLNEGIDLAKGIYLARMDADDISLPSRIEEQVRMLNQQEDLVIVGAWCYFIDEQGTQFDLYCHPESDTQIRIETLFHPCFTHSAVMLRIDTLRRYNLYYDTRAVHCEDYELWSRLLQHGKGMNIPKPLVKYRFHNSQVSHIASHQQHTLLRQISQSNLERIGIPLSLSERDRLCTWYFTFPTEQRLLGEQDRLPCQIVLQILQALTTQPMVDGWMIRQISNEWLHRILLATTLKNLWHYHLIQPALRLNMTFVLHYILRHIMYRLRNIFYSFGRKQG